MDDRVAQLWADVWGSRPGPRSVRRRTLESLRADVHGSRVDRLRRELLDDPKAIRAARVAALRREVDPANAALIRKATFVREFYALRRAREAQLFPLWASGDFSVDLRHHWRRLAGAGDPAAGVLLASAARRQSRAVTAAVVASGAQPGWKITRSKDGHIKAERAVFHRDGRVETEIRWKWRGEGAWLTEAQFEARRQVARIRQRQAARMIPAVGRPARRAR